MLKNDQIKKKLIIFLTKIINFLNVVN